MLVPSTVKGLLDKTELEVLRRWEVATRAKVTDLVMVVKAGEDSAYEFAKYCEQSTEDKKLLAEFKKQVRIARMYPAIFWGPDDTVPVVHFSNSNLYEFNPEDDDIPEPDDQEVPEKPKESDQANTNAAMCTRDWCRRPKPP